MHHFILAAKEKYINELSKNLSNPETEPKTYWKILNRFLSNKKIPSIPPLLVNGEMISNFSKKPNFLIRFLHHNVRRYQTQVLCHLLPSERIKQLSSLKINEDDILSIIKSLNQTNHMVGTNYLLKW